MFALTVCESNYHCRACVTLQHMTIYKFNIYQHYLQGTTCNHYARVCLLSRCTGNVWYRQHYTMLTLKLDITN